MICAMTAPHNGHDGQQDQQSGYGYPGIDESLHRQVQLTAKKSGHAADQHGDHDIDDGRRQTNGQRNTSAVDQAGQQVASDMIGAEQKASRGAGEPVGQAHLPISIGSQDIRKDSRDNEQHDDDSTGGPQGLLFPQPDEEMADTGAGLRLAHRVARGASSPWWNPASHRERRGARLARRDERAYRPYVSEEQRSQTG